jgi:NitT/TauT family transport system permease protein
MPAKIWKYASIRRLSYALIFMLLWQGVYATGLFPAILFPSPITVLQKLIQEFANGSMLVKISYTMYLIFLGLSVSFLIAFILIVLASVSNVAKDLCRTSISLFDPLPGIALLPLAILWFGIGKAAIMFIMVHSILWPMLLSILSGFDSIPKMYREVGSNIGLSKFGMITGIYVPAAFPSILMGIRNGWARAWRALIAAEMVFGTAGAIGGLGWDIYLKRSYLDMPGMLATLIVIMVIGILIEDNFFAVVEKHTVRKWGMTI